MQKAWSLQKNILMLSERVFVGMRCLFWGEVEEVGTHAELLPKGGLYAQFYHTQFQTDLLPLATN